MFLTSVLGWFHLEFPLRNLTIGPTTHVTLSQNSHHSEIDPATPSPPPSGTGPTLFLHLVNDFPPCHPILNQTREWNWRHRLNEPNVLFGGLGGGRGVRCPQKPSEWVARGDVVTTNIAVRGCFCHDTNRPFEDNFLFTSSFAFTQSCFSFLCAGCLVVGRSGEFLHKAATSR